MQDVAFVVGTVALFVAFDLNGRALARMGPHAAPASAARDATGEEAR